jgi:large subunit ribosomal protein L22
MTVVKGLDQLSILPKRSALPVSKLIKSAVANATHNHRLDEKTLVIQSIVANEGPRLKRFQPKAYGRANPILKRTTHITVILEGKELKAAKPVKSEAKPDQVATKDIKHPPAAPSKRTTKTIKPDSSGDKAKERSGKDPIIARKGTE